MTTITLEDRTDPGSTPRLLFIQKKGSAPFPKKYKDIIDNMEGLYYYHKNNYNAYLKKSIDEVIEDVDHDKIGELKNVPYKFKERFYELKNTYFKYSAYSFYFLIKQNKKRCTEFADKMFVTYQEIMELYDDISKYISEHLYLKLTYALKKVYEEQKQGKELLDECDWWEERLYGVKIYKLYSTI
jgi:hypothetical protein